MPIDLYFPAPILMQYVEAYSVSELRARAKEEPVDLYLEFVNNCEEDVRSSILILPSLKSRFREYRNSLHGLILGRDVRLFFSKDVPEIPEWDVSDLEYYITNVDEVKKLKIRKFRVIERIIVTDIVFRLYYDAYPKIKDALKEYREARDLVKNFTVRKSGLYAARVKDYILFDRYHGAVGLTLSYPGQLRGFVSACFPLMSMSSVVQLGMLYFFASGRWYEVNEGLAEAGSRGRISEPTDEFLEDCRLHYESHVERYANFLRRFASEVRAIAEEVDPVEKFIKSCLPATFFDLYDRAKQLGYDVDEVVFRLKDLVRRGVVKADGEKLMLGK